MIKSELRNYFKEKRKLLSVEEVNNLSFMIFERFFQFFTPKNENIHTFLPISSKNEINTFLLLNQLFEQTNCKVITSKADFEKDSLEHFYISKNTKFETDSYGIPVPNSNALAKVEEIDWVIIPLLAFDEKGHRVGYGKGFYDKFLSLCKPNTKKIGISFFEPVKKIDDVSPFDIQLNYCITPNKLYHF